jgi:hypothetical protein
MSGRRLLVLAAILVAAALPAVVLRAACVGRSCASEPAVSGHIPFCGLPEDVRAGIAAGYREGRSPDVMAVAMAGRSIGGPTATALGPVPWPETGPAAVPLVLDGPAIAPGPLPDGTRLDRVAPTVADAIGLDRPFPQVRSGVAIPGVATPGSDHARLVLLVAWEGVGSADLGEGTPFLRTLLREGAGTRAASVGSMPLEPAAILATLGTGALPFQHGVTGPIVRGDDGAIVRPFGPGAPPMVLATLGDDLRSRSRGASRIALIAPSRDDLGLVGGGWYEGQAAPAFVPTGPTPAPDAVAQALSDGFGADPTTDLLGVVLQGTPEAMDRATRRIVEAARAATRGRTLVALTATGRAAPDDAIAASALIDQVEEAVPGDAPVIAEGQAGGLFLDQGVLTQTGITGQAVVDALLAAEDPAGGKMVRDAFQGFAVSFARYCDR